MTQDIPHWTSLVADVPALSETSRELRDPGRPDRVVAYVAEGDADTVSMAVEAARQAFQSWSSLSGPARGDHLSQFLNALEEDSEIIARQITLEQGKVIGESRGEVAKAIGEGRYMLGEAYRSGIIQRPSVRPSGMNIARRIPHGVVAAINPWNFPFSTPMRKIMPALVSGNTIILKPSELTPGPLFLLAKAAIRAGLPKGVINLVLGAGGAVGRSMIDHPGVDMVTFTGSTETGRSIAVAAARRLTPIQLEMGGKNAAVVARSADVQRAVREITRAALVCSGQRCTAISRVLVDQQLVGELTQLLSEAFARIRPGHGLESTSDIGPLVSAEHLDKVHQMVSVAEREGARVVTGGTPMNTSGYFFPATLIDGANAGALILKQEVFGPVLTVTPFRNLEEALSLHEDSDYGLTGSIFATDPAEVEFLRDRMTTGMLHINSGTFPENNMPFAGAKHSALGAPSVGEQALDGFSRWQSVYT